MNQLKKLSIKESKFKSFDSSHIGVGGKLIKIEEDFWLEERHILKF